MRVSYNKLIRDRIPEVIRADGRHPVTRALADDDYQAALVEKLAEEAGEARAASAEDLPNELADVLEVIEALLPTLGMTWQDLLTLAAAKREKRGAFTRRLFLDYVE